VLAAQVAKQVVASKQGLFDHSAVAESESGLAID
jgi:hypothetical protein